MEEFKYNLYPYRFKKLGFLLALPTLVMFVCFHFFNIPIWDFLGLNEVTFYKINSNAFLIGLFFIIQSKDKDEDEMSIYIRMNVMSRLFVFTILYYVYISFFETMGKMNVFEFILFFQLVYLIGFYLNKWKSKRTMKKMEQNNEE